MGNEIEKLEKKIDDVLNWFGNYCAMGCFDQGKMIKARSQILKAISEAGYICVGKGAVKAMDEPLSEDFGEAMRQVLRAEKEAVLGDDDAPSKVCPQCQGIGEILIQRPGTSGIWEICPACGGKR